MAKTGPSPRYKKDIRIKPDVVHKPKVRACSIKGCGGEGAYKVPKSRDQISTYLWVCLEHAREHNEKWDYFKGMSDAEVAKFQEEAVIGHRPTWRLGERAAGLPGGEAPFRGTFHIEDGFAVFGDAQEPVAPRRPERVLTRLQRQAFDILDLEASATLNEIKARYKELVKRFHPDANGGNRGTEERLKQVIKAYGVLRASGIVS
jgi:hypothetical protein